MGAEARHGVTDVQKLFREVPRFEDRDTLVEVLKRVDETYVAAHFGKWHILGDPAEMGFDFSDGETGNKEGGFALKDEYRTRLKEDPKLTNSLKQRSVAFLEQMAKEGNSFFLQISHYANHTWVVADPDDFDKQPMKESNPMEALYRAMTVALDRSVEGVLDCLDQLGLAKTLMSFLHPDNGAVPSLHSFEKTSTYEYSLDRCENGVFEKEAFECLLWFAVQALMQEISVMCRLVELIFYLHFLN